MPVLLTSPHDRTYGINLLKSALALFIMPGAGKVKDGIIKHVADMESNSLPLNVDCRFETFPADKETKLTITFKHGPGEFVNTTDELIWRATDAYRH